MCLIRLGRWRKLSLIIKIYNTPFVVAADGGGPMGPNPVAGEPSDVVTDVDDVLVVFSEAPPSALEAIVVVDFIMKNFSNLAMMCLP